MLAACSRLHSAELRVELLEVQRQVQRRRGQAARAAGWAGIMPTPSPAAGLSGRVPIHENGVRVMDREPVFLIGGEGGEHPGGDGVLRGDGGRFGAVSPHAVGDGESVAGAPTADLAPRDGLAIAAAESEASHVLEDTVASDQGAIVVGEGI